MGRDPYIAAWRARTRHRRRVEGPLPGVLRAALPVVVSGLLLPLLRPVFLSFLDEGPAALAGGLSGVVLRMGFLLVGALALDVYAALIRSPDRAVFDLHPVDPAGVVSMEILRVAAARAPWIPAAAVALGPVAVVSGWRPWAAAVAALAGVWGLALTASACMHLGAVWMAENEAAAPILDALRGSNPRAQAAFLYAPGAILAAVGGIVWLAADGVARVVAGDPIGWGALVVAPAVGAIAWIPVPRLARATWFRASAVLADIDARYAALEQREDGTRVYLDWAVRWLPDRLVPYVLKDLRHGWRGRRTWILAAWGIGAAGALAGWQGGGGAPAVAAAVGVLGVFLVAAVGVVLERDDPPFLRAWLPVDAKAVRIARGLAVWGWLQGAVWASLPTVWLRHGLGAGLSVVGVVLVAAVGAAALSAVCSIRPRVGLVVYGPVAAFLAAGLVGAFVGGVG